MKKLKAARELRGLTQEQLASRAGVSVPTISRLEQGHRKPNVGTLERLAGALGFVAQELMD